MQSKIETFRQWVAESENIVFFGGAGVSTESGIPDFRSVDGLYSQKYDDPPETILSHSYFMRSPEAFYTFYRDKMMPEGVLPNAAHRKLAELEQAGKLRAVITQNIDGLHQAAGSQNVLELHGTVHRNTCMACGAKHGYDAVKGAAGVPRCHCGGTIKPDVVLYEEGLDADTMSRAVRHIAQADMLIIGGTSLVVYPAAGLVSYYKGDKLVLINRSATGMDSLAHLLIQASLGETLGAL